MVQSSQSIKTWRYLDPHFIIPMLDFLGDSNLVPADELFQARIKTVAATNMTDYLIDLYQESNQAVPVDLAASKTQLMADMETKQSQLRPLLHAIEEGGIDSMKQLSLADFCLKYNLSTDVLDVLFDHSRQLYQVGAYERASDLLRIYRRLTSSTDASSVPTDRQIRAMWGSIACYIALAEYTSASELLVKLMEFFDTTTLPKDKFSSGASAIWMLHWSILVILKSPSDQVLGHPLVSMILREKYLGIVSVSAPYLWKYISAIIILQTGSAASPVSNHTVTDVAVLISKDSEASSDHLSKMLIELYQNFNFEAAEQLAESELYLTSDYFLVGHEQALKSKAVELIRSVRQKLYS